MGKQADRLRERLRGVAKAIPERVDAVAKTLAIDGASTLVAASIVDTGQMRHGWDVGIGEVSPFRPADGLDSYPDDAMARIQGKTKSAPVGSAYLITNNLPQTYVIETGGFVPTDPGPSKGRGRKGSKRRQRTQGIVLVSGGFHTAAPAGLLSQARATIERRLREFERAGLPKRGSK